MNINLIDVVVKKNDKEIFSKLNLSIPTNKIIGLCGNLRSDFINLLKTKVVNEGEIVDNGLLDSLYLLNDYQTFMTSNLEDELYLLSCKYDINRDDFIHELKDWSLDESYMNKDISTLSSCEKKIIKTILVFFTNKQLIIIKDIFNNLDYNYKRQFINKISRYRKKYGKSIIVDDESMDSLYSLVDKFLVIDSSLIAINNFEKIVIMEEFHNTNITIPNIINFTNLLKEKGFNVKYHKSINKLVEEVKSYVS